MNKEIIKDVKRVKKALIKKVLKKGLYENFGQKEISKLRSKYFDFMYKEDFKPIEELEKFCLNFDYNDLNLRGRK